MIGSICAYMASKAQFLSDYCASKGAVVALAKGLGVELAPMNIRVNSISPGYVTHINGGCSRSLLRPDIATQQQT